MKNVTMTKAKEAKDMVMGEAEEELEEAITTNRTKEKEVDLFKEIVEAVEETRKILRKRQRYDNLNEFYNCNKILPSFLIM